MIRRSLKIFFYISITIYSSSWGTENLRRCLLLPIERIQQTSISLQVFKGLENYLLTSGWCHYQYSSEVLNILSRHQMNLKEFLNDSMAIASIAKKTASGTIVKVKITIVNEIVDLSLKVLGDNGHEIYFLRKKQLGRVGVKRMIDLAIEWLNVYRSIIPYDGRIISIGKDHFTFDLYSKTAFHVGNTFKIGRSLKKIQHPFLNQIVSWTIQNIDVGKITSIDNGEKFHSKTPPSMQDKIKVGDWIFMDDVKKKNPLNAKKVSEKRSDPKDDKFFHIGRVTLGIHSGQAVTSRKEDDNYFYDHRGVKLGFELDLTFNLTEYWWVSGGMIRGLNFYYEKVDFLYKDLNMGDLSKMKFSIGRHFFLTRTQLDTYLGYNKMCFDVLEEELNWTTSSCFKGWFIGTSLHLKIDKFFKIFVLFDYTHSPSYSSDTFSVEKDASSQYLLKLGGNYLQNKQVELGVSLNYQTNFVLLKNNTLTYKEFYGQISTTFMF